MQLCRKDTVLLRFAAYLIYMCEPVVKAGLFFLLYRVTGYRKKVVLANLQRCFPHQSETERKRLVKAFYHNLAHVLVESVVVFAIRKKKLMERCRVLNPELFNELAAEKVSALCISGHIANWEWGGIAIGNASPMHNVAVYLPLKNKYVDRMMRQTRTRLTKLDTLVPSREIFRALLKAPRPFQTYIVADQSPSREHHHRVPFLGQDTAFFNGPAKMAQKMKLGMIFIETRRIAPGRYEVELKLMFKDGSKLSEEEITAQYAAHLEAAIRKNPSDWLWSHKRWKF